MNMKIEVKDGDYYQAVMGLGYDQWQAHDAEAGKGEHWQYIDMLDWVEREYGSTARVLIQVGKYNQQVRNGGHVQYADNGYADGRGGCFQQHDTIECHEWMVDTFVKLGLDKLKRGFVMLGIMQDFNVEVDEERYVDEEVYDEEEDEYYNEEVFNEQYGQIVNDMELQKLDSMYYTIDEAVWLAELNDVAEGVVRGIESR